MINKNHPEHITCALMEAEQACTRAGVRLTKLRWAILELLLLAEGPVKAYDIIEKMREQGERLTPATVYRVLDFLLQYGLAHRINALNAFVPCTGKHSEQALLMFVCSKCQQTEELDDPVLCQSIKNRLEELGMSLHDSRIEIQGECKKCRK